jgi:hypothetical protein
MVKRRKRKISVLQAEAKVTRIYECLLGRTIHLGMPSHE